MVTKWQFRPNPRAFSALLPQVYRKQDTKAPSRVLIQINDRRSVSFRAGGEFIGLAGGRSRPPFDVLFHAPGVLRQSRGCPNHQWRGLRGTGIVALAGDRERVADNGLEHQAVRSRREAVTDANLNVDRLHLEIGDGVQFLVLLSQRQKIADPAEVGVVFEADEPVLPEIAGKPQRGSEIRLTARPEADIHDRIGDELPLGVSRL